MLTFKVPKVSKIDFKAVFLPIEKKIHFFDGISMIKNWLESPKLDTICNSKKI